MTIPTPPLRRVSVLLCVLWVCSAGLLAVGLSRPVIQISVNIEGVIKDALDRQPIVGLLLQEKGLKVSDIASKLPPTSETRQSITSSVNKLFNLKAYAAATLVLMFSVIVPILKQLAMLYVIALPNGQNRRLSLWTQAVHKWAMLDVFVLSLVVLTLSSATAWNASFQDGFYWFLGYFFSAGVLSILLSRKPRPPVGIAVAGGPSVI